MKQEVNHVTEGQEVWLGFPFQVLENPAEMQRVILVWTIIVSK